MRNRTTATAFLLAVTRWSQVLRDLESTTSEQAVSALLEANLYPTYEAIRALISDFGIDDLSAVDVQNALRVLSERAPFIEQRIDMAGISAEVELHPPVLINRLPPRAASAIRDIFVSLAVFCRNANSAPPDIGTIDIHVEEAVVTATVDLVETYGGDIFELTGDLRIVCQTFDLVRDAAELLSEDWADVCRDPHRAIQHLYRSECKEHAGSPESIEIRLGPGFVASIVARGIDKHPSTLRRLYKLCALAGSGRLAHVPGAKVHAVRESTAADAPQVVRDNGDKKWRCMVSKRGAGFRLHYWTSASGVELDEVLVESEV